MMRNELPRFDGRVPLFDDEQHNQPAVGTAALFTPKTAPPEGGWP
jgi:hypothetical protein